MRLLVLVVLLGALLSAVPGCANEVSRWPSPDGRFEAVVYEVPSLRIGMPGGGSDGPGELEIVRVSDGASCGRAPLELRWMGHEVRFEADRAHLTMVADWDLRTCSVSLVGEH